MNKELQKVKSQLKYIDITVINETELYFELRIKEIITGQDFNLIIYKEVFISHIILHSIKSNLYNRFDKLYNF